MEILAKYFKKADKEKNRVIIPKPFIDKYGREFYLSILENGTILLEPIKKRNKTSK